MLCVALTRRRACRAVGPPGTERYHHTPSTQSHRGSRLRPRPGGRNRRAQGRAARRQGL